MTLPSKVYEPELTSYGLSYFPRKDSREESLVQIDFPTWLFNLIESEKKDSYKSGYEQAQREIRSVLGIH